MIGMNRPATYDELIEETMPLSSAVEAELNRPYPTRERLAPWTRTNDILATMVLTMRNRKIDMTKARQMIQDEYIRQVLWECRGNQCKAAKILKIHRNTLGRMNETSRKSVFSPFRPSLEGK